MSCKVKQITFVCCMGIAASLAAAEGPKMSDAEWITMGQARGVYTSVSSCVFDKSGNLIVNAVCNSTVSPLRNDVSRWDGSHWSSVGDGVYESSVLAVDGVGTIISAGKFSGPDSTFIKLSSWDGSSWKSLGKCFENVGKGYLKRVNALTVDNSGNVYIGGFFDSLGTCAASNIAKWDGKEWSPLGSGLNDKVTSIAIDNKGNVFAGGAFSYAGGVEAAHIARWDGISWTSHGNGFNDTVYSLKIDSAQNLYAGGAFTSSGIIGVNRVAKWNGTTWEALGEGTNKAVTALAIDVQGNIIAGGAFDSAGNSSASHIAKWNGTTWSPIGKGLEGIVLTIITDDKGRLFAGGSIYSSTTTVDYLAQWSDSIWHSVGSGNGNNYGYLNNVLWDNSGNCYVHGLIQRGIGGEHINTIGKWDGRDWKTMGAELDGIISQMIIKNDGKLLVARRFSIPGDTVKISVAEWDGVAWNTVGPKINGYIEDMKFDKKGVLYICGDFEPFDTCASLCKLEGDKWIAVGKENDNVREFDFDRNNKLYAAISVRSALECNLARWDDTAWTACGGATDKRVNDMKIDEQNNIYIAGNFRRVGDLDVHYIARWDGTKWNKVGSGTDGVIKELAIDSRQNLYAVGKFKFAGGFEASNIAFWDGNEWSSVGSNVNINGVLMSISISDIYGLVVGGDFSMVNGRYSEDIAFVRFPETNVKTVINKNAVPRKLNTHVESGNIIYRLDHPEYVTIRIFSLSGREEFHFSGHLSAGDHLIEKGRMKLSKGFHIARMTAGKNTTEMRFVTVK